MMWKSLFLCLLVSLTMELGCLGQKSSSQSLVKDFYSLPIDFRQFSGSVTMNVVQGDCSMSFKQESGEPTCIFNYSIETPFTYEVKSAREKFSIHDLVRRNLDLGPTSTFINSSLSGKLTGISVQTGKDSPQISYSEGTINFYLDSLNLLLTYSAVTGPKFQGSIRLSVYQYILCKELFQNRKLSKSEVESEYSLHQNVYLSSSDTSFVQIGHNKYKYYINERLVYAKQEKSYYSNGTEFTVRSKLPDIINFNLYIPTNKTVYNIDVVEDWKGMENRRPDWADDDENSESFYFERLLDSPILRATESAVDSNKFKCSLEIGFNSSYLECDECKFNRLSSNTTFETIFKDSEFSNQIKSATKYSAFKIQTMLIYKRYMNLNDRRDWTDEPIEIYIEFYKGDRPLIYELIKGNKELESFIDSGFSYFKSGQYAEAKSKFEAAYKIQNINYILNLIDNCNSELYEIAFDQGSKFYSDKKYGLAKSKFLEAQGFLISAFADKKPEETMANALKALIVECDFIPAVQLGDEFLEKRSYSEAAEEYEIAARLKPEDTYVQRQIELIDLTVNFLDRRDTEIFQYSKFNNADFKNLQNAVITTLNENISKSLSGNIQGLITVAFDTSGINKSSVSNYSSNIASQVFEKLLFNSNLKPINFYGYFAASKEEIALNGTWNTVKTKHEYRNNKLVAYSNSNDTYASYVNSLAREYSLDQGSFKGTLKTIDFNKQFHSEMEISKYKPLGPSNALYSLVFPCLGTYRIDSFEKFKTRFTSFTVAAGCAALLHWYSNSSYDDYLKETEPTNKENLYKMANNMHKLSLISFGVMGSIYLYDIAEVFAIGLKNKRKCKPLTNVLKNGPIKIKVDPIKSL